MSGFRSLQSGTCLQVLVVFLLKFDLARLSLRRSAHRCRPSPGLPRYYDGADSFRHMRSPLYLLLSGEQRKVSFGFSIPLFKASPCLNTYVHLPGVSLLCPGLTVPGQAATSSAVSPGAHATSA